MDNGHPPKIFCGHPSKIFGKILSRIASSLIKQLSLIASTSNIFAVIFPARGYCVPRKEKGRRSRWREGGRGGERRDERGGLGFVRGIGPPTPRFAEREVGNQQAAGAEEEKRRGPSPSSCPPGLPPICSSFYASSFYTFFSFFFPGSLSPATLLGIFSEDGRCRDVRHQVPHTKRW